jgi:hypothetical protein
MLFGRRPGGAAGGSAGQVQPPPLPVTMTAPGGDRSYVLSEPIDPGKTVGHPLVFDVPSDTTLAYLRIGDDLSADAVIKVQSPCTGDARAGHLSGRCALRRLHIDPGNSSGPDPRFWRPALTCCNCGRGGGI